MASWFPLAIFPEGALASSVITTVLVGVWVTVFFNLRFGWVLSGLVVPGYLAPLILLEPVSAAVVAVEAVITYAIVRLISVYLADAIGWTTFFGRDRFFALVVVSVAVRLVMDGLVLPPIAAWLNTQYDIGFDWTRQLESFGLIIIALYANQFWKTGLVRGLFTSGVTILLTVLIVRYGLMEVTNFRISDIGYLYELLAASLLASSKAYVILILTAFIASRINLRAGLDFNGLLIPALVALQWYEPMKIVTSIGEALIILALASALLRTPYFADKTIEGGRKLLLFFNISFAWKMLVGYAVLWSGYEIKTADLYGFGYLLSTLVALKLHDKGGTARMLTALTVVSAQGAVAGTVAGFALSEGARALGPMVEQPEELRPEPDEVESDMIAMAVQRSAAAARTEAPELPDPEVLLEFGEGLSMLVAGIAPDASNLDALAEARCRIARAGFAVRVTPETRLVIEPVLPQTGRTVILIDPASATDLTVSLPDAQRERGLTSAAAALFELTGARALIVQGRADTAQSTGPQSLFHAAHAALGGSIVQLTSTGPGRPVLEVAGRYPQAFDLVDLERHVGPVSLVGGAHARRSPQRAVAATGFALLDLAPDALHALTGAIHSDDIYAVPDVGGFAGHMRRQAARNAEAATVAPPGLADLVYAETEILVPLFEEVLPDLRDGTGIDEATIRTLVSLDVAAGSIGYSLRLLRDAEGRASHVILGSDSVSWGSYAFRIGPAKPVFVHVPSGLRDQRTLNFGLSVFNRLGAQAILIAGRIDRDGLPAADLNVLNPDHPPGLFDLVAKLLIQSDRGESVSLVLRNIDTDTVDELPDIDLILSPDNVLGGEPSGPVITGVMADFDVFGLNYVLHEGTEAFAGFEPGALPQAGVLSARPDAWLMSLWLSPGLLDHYADRLGPSAELTLFRMLGLPNRRGRLGALAGGCVLPGPLPEALGDRLRIYHETRSPMALQALAGQGVTLHRFEDAPTRQSFVILRAPESGCLVAIANLAPADPASAREISGDALTASALSAFAESRAAILTVSEVAP